jgi:hypothetical protein
MIKPKAFHAVFSVVALLDQNATPPCLTFPQLPETIESHCTALAGQACNVHSLLVSRTAT